MNIFNAEQCLVEQNKCFSLIFQLVKKHFFLLKASIYHINSTDHLSFIFINQKMGFLLGWAIGPLWIDIFQTNLKLCNKNTLFFLTRSCWVWIFFKIMNAIIKSYVKWDFCCTMSLFNPTLSMSLNSNEAQLTFFPDNRLFSQYHSKLSDCLSDLVNAIHKVMKSK